MSHNIDNVQVQIPGTMYYLQLTADRGRWILALLLRGDVENEVIVPVFSKNGIVKTANELLNNTRIQMEKYPLKNVCDQLFSEAERSLPIAPTKIVEDVLDASEINDIKQKLDLLENTLNNVNEELKENINIITERLDSLENDRVTRLEKEIAKDDYRGKEEIIENLAGRLDIIEESIAKTKGDDRVPSILTAIEALESKLSQLEGKAVTSTEGRAPLPAEDDVGLIEDLGKLSQVFDVINRRISDLEVKISSQTTTEPKLTDTAPIEGAPDVQPPTTKEKKFTEG